MLCEYILGVMHLPTLYVTIKQSDPIRKKKKKSPITLNTGEGGKWDNCYSNSHVSTENGRGGNHRCKTFPLKNGAVQEREHA